ncbi:MAG: glycosyltransferase family 2 protein [Ignavibacteria bacterium]|nr:glycosyltransferase family 2 protein [Ignavibacteria bacterium]
MAQPLTVVIMLNYNGAKDTVECIESVQRIDYENYRILIVDNCSTDNSVEVFRERFPALDLYVTEKNLGYTGGINRGFREASKFGPKYMLVLNNDTIVEPNFLSELVNAMESDPQAAAAGGLILAEHDRKTIWFGNGKMIKWRGLAIHLDKGLPVEKKSHNQVTETDFLTGCMILFRTDHLAKAGLEDEDFFMYLDDIEFSARLKKYGFKLLYQPAAVIYHKVLGERESPLKLYYSVRNRFLLNNKMNSGIVRLISAIYFFAVISLKIVVWSFTNKPFAKVARAALNDYFAHNLGSGRGPNLTGILEG